MVIKAMAVRIMAPISIGVLRKQKGADSDELFHELGEFLLGMFRGRLLLQFLFIRVRGLAHGPAVSAAFPWARWRCASAFGWQSGGTCPGHGCSWTSCRRRA